MVVKLDKKDWKLLGQLDLDARQTYSQIAKKVGLSKEVVRYRIKNLEDKKIFRGYRFYINTKKLGYDSFKWFLQLENTTEKVIEQMVTELTANPNVAWINSLTGRWDLAVVFFAKTPHQFDQMTNDFLLEYSSHVREHTFTIELDIFHFKRKGLFKQRGTKEKVLYYGGDQETIKLKEKEIVVLSQLAEDPTRGLVEMYKRTGLSTDIIKYQIKKLEENNILQGTELDINYEKLGIEWHKILINRKKLTTDKEKRFLGFLKQHKNVIEIIYCLGGHWNTEINVEVNNGLELHQVIMEIKNLFPEMIKSYDFVKNYKNYKFTFFPMGMNLLKKLA